MSQLIYVIALTGIVQINATQTMILKLATSASPEFMLNAESQAQFQTTDSQPEF